MQEKLAKIREEAIRQIQEADVPEKLNEARVKFLGKKGELTAVLKGMKDGIDCNIYFFDTKVELWVMYLVLIGATLLFLGAYVLVNAIQAKRK